MGMSVAFASLLGMVQQPASVPEDLRGRVVGVCIRWGDDRQHVAEAVVVVPSGHDALDRGMPESIRRRAWPSPTGNYGGGWVGIWLIVGENVSPADLPIPFPDCSRLPPPPPTAPTT